MRGNNSLFELQILGQELANCRKENRLAGYPIFGFG